LCAAKGERIIPMIEAKMEMRWRRSSHANAQTHCLRRWNCDGNASNSPGQALSNCRTFLFAPSLFSPMRKRILLQHSAALTNIQNEIMLRPLPAIHPCLHFRGSNLKFFAIGMQHVTSNLHKKKDVANEQYRPVCSIITSPLCTG
jgi:hypothetical protein